MQSQTKLAKLSITYFLSTFLLLITLTFAWISLRNQADSSLIVTIGNVEMEYELYFYKDILNRGATSFTLQNECATEEHYQCYQQIDFNQAPYLFGTTRKVVPNNKFTFALVVRNIGTQDVIVNIDLSNLTTTGYDIVENKVQRAFHYSVAKIAYTANENEDIKDVEPIDISSGYFTIDNNNRYSLVENIYLSYSDLQTNAVVIFFHLYFDPNISGLNENLEPTGTSNEFANQLFTIHRIFVWLKNT